METDYLKKAISELPQFKAPDVWNKIRREIPRKSSNLLLLFSVSIVITLTTTGLLVLKSKEIISSVPFQVRNENSPLMRYVNEEDAPETTAVITKFDKSNRIAEHQAHDSISKSENLQEKKNITVVNNIAEVPAFYQIIATTKIVYEETGANLVANGDFEEFVFCPVGFTERPIRKLIPHWEVPSKGTPDYFNACSKRDAGVPSNFAGRIFAHSGFGYAGLILRSSFTNENKITGVKPLDYREYIQTELYEPLVRGKRYKIQFWVCNSSGSRYAVDAIGAVFTGDKIRVENSGVLDYTPVVKNSRNNMLINQAYWIAVEGIYEAKGGEKFLTIGNFNYNYATLFTMMDPSSKFNYAYYYIDDVTVIEVTETYETEYIKIDSVIDMALKSQPE